MKKITGRLTEKNGKWYAVINLYDMSGKRKEKWQNLHLDVKRGNKTEANHRLMEVVAQYNSEDMFLYANMTHAEREKRRLAECTVNQYVAEWLDGYKGNLSVLTYNNYKLMADTRIAKYFQKLGVPLKEITGDELNDFYAYLRNDGLSGASAQRYHSLLHIAFKQAGKRESNREYFRHLNAIKKQLSVLPNCSFYKIEEVPSPTVNRFGHYMKC